MGKGFFWGLIWGWVVAVLGLASASMYLPMPDVMPKSAELAGEIEVPAGSEFNKSKTDDAAMLPKDDGAAVAKIVPDPVVVETGTASASNTAMDTASASVPQVSMDSPSAMTTPTIAAPTGDTTGAAPLLPKEEGDVPSLLGDGATPTVPAKKLMPQIETSDAATPKPALTAPVAEIPPAAIAIGVPVSPLVSQSQAPATEVAAGDATEEPRALVRNAKAFDNPEAKPLMSIVLITPPDQTLAPALLEAFSFPVTFAVDPLDPDAANRAQAYFDAGFEVVFLANGIAAGSSAQNVEVVLEASIAAVPTAVAILDSATSVLKSNSEIQKQTADKLAKTGHGIVTYEGGLNSTLREADKLGVKNTTIFRVLDGDGESAFSIKRYLARASFRAGQAGDVVVIGHTTGETLQAVIEWSLDERPDEVILAPISAVLALPR